MNFNEIQLKQIEKVIETIAMLPLSPEVKRITVIRELEARGIILPMKMQTELNFDHEVLKTQPFGIFHNKYICMIMPPFCKIGK